MESPATPASSTTASYLIDNVRLFDGVSVTASMDVLTNGTTILDVASSISAPPGATVINGSGKTLLPGLIDSHAHPLTVNMLSESLLFGVTSVMGQHEPLAVTQFQQCAGPSPDRAYLFPAIAAATAAGGHAEPGRPTISHPSEADDFVADRIAEGAHHIKIIREDLSLWGAPAPVPQIGLGVVHAVAKAAHDNGKVAVVHSTKRSDAELAVALGADGLAHAPVDEVAGVALRQLMLYKEAFLIPTLAVEQTADGFTYGDEPLDDPLMEPWLTPGATAILEADNPPGFTDAWEYATPKESVGYLHEAGVPILAGSDAPVPKTAMGATLLRDLQLLVDAGLTPLEAMRSATSVPATHWQLGDRGSIADGKLADMVLVNGDPTTDIDDIRDIDQIWRMGTKIDRAALLTLASGSEPTCP
ncbi:amidohydrolase family protein [Streptosporangium sp. OZ121]|uniref:amidohydrolase family protein n=1 Tax=Streptosporangium sp. OZ121 TaxID=3444183 RepID=UPI003F79F149